MKSDKRRRDGAEQHPHGRQPLGCGGAASAAFDTTVNAVDTFVRTAAETQGCLCIATAWNKTN
jgi:hypothetical protein